MRRLEALRQWLVRLENGAAALSLLALLLLAVSQIIARNFFEIGLPVADKLTRILVLYVMFFGAVLAIERRRHIKIDILCTLMPAALTERLYRPVQAVAAFICLLFALAAIRFWRDEWAYAADYERWQTLVILIIPVGFVLLSLHFVLAVLLGKNPAVSHEPEI